MKENYRMKLINVSLGNYKLIYSILINVCNDIFSNNNIKLSYIIYINSDSTEFFFFYFVYPFYQ